MARFQSQHVEAHHADVEFAALFGTELKTLNRKLKCGFSSRGLAA